MCIKHMDESFPFLMFCLQNYTKKRYTQKNHLKISQAYQLLCLFFAPVSPLTFFIQTFHDC